MITNLYINDRFLKDESYSDDMYISSHTRRKDLLKSLEQITKNEIEWSTSEEESDEWSKLHDHIILLQKKYI